LIGNRNDKFNAFFEVSRHRVSGANVNVIIAAVAKKIEKAATEEAAYNTDYHYIV